MQDVRANLLVDVRTTIKNIRMFICILQVDKTIRAAVYEHFINIRLKNNNVPVQLYRYIIY